MTVVTRFRGVSFIIGALLIGVYFLSTKQHNGLTGALLDNGQMQFQAQSPYAQMQNDGTITIPTGSDIQLDWSDTDASTVPGTGCYLFSSRDIDGLTTEKSSPNLMDYFSVNETSARNFYGVGGVHGISSPVTISLKCYTPQNNGYILTSSQTVQVNVSSSVSTAVVQPYAHRAIAYPAPLAPFTFTLTAGSSVLNADGVLDVKPGSDVVLSWSSNLSQVQDACSLQLSEPIPNPIVPQSTIHPALAQNAGAGGIYWGVKSTGTMTLPNLQKPFTVSMDCFTQIPPQGGTAYDFTVYRTVFVQPQAQCKDGIDNDGDGTTDYPQDLDCADANDNSENTILTTYSCNAAQFSAANGTFQSQGWQVKNNAIGINSPAVDSGETYIRITKDISSSTEAGVFLPIPKNQLQDKNWAIEMKARIRGSTSTYPVGMNMFFVAPDARYTGMYLNTSVFGTLKSDLTYLHPISRDTSSAFHIYRIENHENGAGVLDDTFDVIFDGVKVISAERLSDVAYWPGEDFNGIAIGQFTSTGAGSMDVAYVKYWNNEGQSTCGVGQVSSVAISSLAPSSSSLNASVSSTSSASSLLASSLSSISLSSVSSSIAAVCGNGVKTGTESCDDGNIVNNDGCSSICTVETGYVCTGQTPSICLTVCGDGKSAGTEQCDDGNRFNGDGCNSNCQTEAGYACTGSPSVCVTSCGNGQLNAGETCDDGNAIAGDGCSNACFIEAGWSCLSGGSCTPICGDGQKKGSEQCDDSNTVSGDGCTATCTTESGYDCSTGICKTICGDGMKKGAEECDDGNKSGGDGCSGSCRTEVGYSCLNGGCVPLCGDGAVLVGEQCDDGNTTPNDGCSVTCTTESGWICSGAPSRCNNLHAAAATSSSPALVFSQQSSFNTTIYSSAHSASAINAVAIPSYVFSEQASSVSSALFPQESSQIYTYNPPVSSAAFNYIPLMPTIISSSNTLHEPPTSSSMSLPSVALLVPTLPNPFTTSSQQMLQSACGNGLQEAGETCDRGVANSNTPGALCRTNCQLARCGDGIADTPIEQCDEGTRNGMTDSTCSSQCKIQKAEQALAATIFNLPIALQSPQKTPVSDGTPLIVAANTAQSPFMLNPLTATLPTHAPVGATGPGSLAMMAAGAAAGVGYVRRKNRKITK